MSLSIYPLPITSTRGGGSIYPLPDNIVSPCMYVVVVDIYNSLPDNFDMRGGRYIYPLSTVITYTRGDPSALSLDQNSRGYPNPRKKQCQSPTPSRRAPTRSTNSLEATQIYQVKRALSSRPPQTLEALLRPPQTLEALPRPSQTLEKRRGQATNMIPYCA